jgi:hypothetical protein
MKQQLEKIILSLLIVLIATFIWIPSSQAASDDKAILQNRVEAWANAWEAVTRFFR